MGVKMNLRSLILVMAIGVMLCLWSPGDSDVTNSAPSQTTDEKSGDELFRFHSMVPGVAVETLFELAPLEPAASNTPVAIPVFCIGIAGTVTEPRPLSLAACSMHRRMAR